MWLLWCEQKLCAEKKVCINQEVKINLAFLFLKLQRQKKNDQEDGQGY